MAIIDMQYAGEPVAVLASDIDKAASLVDLGVAIDRFSEAVGYQILHFGVSKSENILVRDVIYTRPVTGSTLQVADFSEDVRRMIFDEARILLKPFDIMRHEFQTCDTAHFDELRKIVSSAGIGGVMVIPYKYENTVSMVIVRCDYDKFMAEIIDILPAVYTLVSKTFARFPTLAKWPDEYLLTRREAEVVQMASMGSLEKSIARQLGISLHTVRIHIENAKRKLEARSKTHAILLAAASGEINALTDQSRRK